MYNSISELHNKYVGQRCFILGNGPSLNKTDVTLLKDEFTFGVNSIFLMTKENGFKPSFFVVEDNVVFSENKTEIDNYDGVIKLFPKHYLEQLSPQKNAYSFNMNQEFYNRSKKARFGVPYFNNDNSEAFFCGQSVTYINLQLAYYLGFSEVYLIGMDFSYSKPKGHVQNGNHIKSDADDVNHFHKDYFGKGKTWKDPRLGRVLRSYYRAKHEFEVDGRKIFNATAGGELELFDRVKFEAVVAK
ncbi:6-hydroxymethylpterin diphosphokinase MptE-like protein [Alteromonas macleodii]|uniref:6-hydroxymethylpterin diphosphokinase MptE-like protein n=1 Tax=Alteromonas macleodii TaxID=28108 RepID=UPI0009B8F4F2|nr:6-hydroxymethylpterin diphosphokinase MptE-like protein [Alteromonas macleodii]